MSHLTAGVLMLVPALAVIRLDRRMERWFEKRPAVALLLELAVFAAGAAGIFELCVGTASL